MIPACGPKEERAPQAPARDCPQIYLELLKRCLTDRYRVDSESPPYEILSPRPGRSLRAIVGNGLKRVLRANGIFLCRPREGWRDLQTRIEEREEGRDWPERAETMIGLKRLSNIQYCLEDVLRHGIKGDFLEAGAWRGGACIFARAVLRAYGVHDRAVWVADSFEGLPPPRAEEYPADAGDRLHTYEELRVSLDTVKANFERYGLLDEQVRFLKGRFSETLPIAPIESLAVLRLDGDMYESTLTTLTALYHRVSAGGFVIVDDYSLAPCRQAVEDFRRDHGIAEAVWPIDWTGVFWQKISPAQPR